MERFAVVCCVESGPLEAQTVRLVESLRTFGGRLGSAPVFAVRARIGPPLVRSTRAAFDRLGVSLLDVRPRSGYAWHHYLNKVHALAAAEQASDVDVLCWLDGDILVVDEPSDLLLAPDEGFAAAVPDGGLVGSTGESDERDPFWRRAAQNQGLQLESMPWMDTDDGERIRFYVNSGVFSYRPATGLASAYLDACMRYLRRHVPRTHDEVHFMDQVVLGLTVLELGLPWRRLPASHNYCLVSGKPERFERTDIGEAALVHYHDCMKPELWPRLLGALADAHPEVHDWLRPLGPLGDPSSAPARLTRKALRWQRGLARRRYYRVSGVTR